MKLLDWIKFIAGSLITGLVTVVVFFVSFEFYLAFGPFIVLFGMIRDLFSRGRRTDEDAEDEE